ncbi:MAG: hypothetical protein HOP31_03185 [Ignavibacteria bacterium]|nr:hypothetical protein [Ignavibacteria bacterium]
MTHKQQILNCLQKETDLCKRLFTLTPAELYNYAPIEGMRTTLELLKYLSWSAGSCVETYMETDKEKQKGIYSRNDDYGETMKPEEFPQRMDEQMGKITRLLENTGDDELLSREVVLPWREPKTLGEALMETSLKWITGYKMQLFLYLRMNGIEVDTGDCWIQTEG